MQLTELDENHHCQSTSDLISPRHLHEEPLNQDRIYCIHKSLNLYITSEKKTVLDFCASRAQKLRRKKKKKRRNNQYAESFNLKYAPKAQ